MADVESNDGVDLTNCDREPIHIPGAILPHGAMLVIDEGSSRILQVAGDTAGLIGVAPEALIDNNYAALLSPAQVERIRSLCVTSDLTKPRHLLDPALRIGDHRAVDASIHRSNGNLVIEYEEADPADPHAVDPLACVQEMLDGIDRCPNLHEFCQLAADRVRGATGYDRVMVYRFQPDDSGWVFAEARDDRIEPLLDLHYPASDIPKQARALFLQHWLRIVAQVDYEPAPLTPKLNPITKAPLDMSQAILRDVSPIHREYLRNMGVGATMTISIIVQGKLWGLVACHHRSPKRLPRHLRAICELFGAMFSLQLEARERALRLERRIAARHVLHDILADLMVDPDHGAGLNRQSSRLLDYIDAGGLALRVGSKGGVAIRVNHGIHTSGETPSEDQIAALTDWLAGQMAEGEGIFHTDRLGEMWPPAAEFANVASGLLALSISVEPRDFILWFRPEVIETVRWAGNPDKPVESGPNGERLTPRQSFAAWSEEVRGRSAPWATCDADAATDLRLSLLDIVLRRIDAIARERERALQQERLLMHELDHRVKNTLANIQSLVSQTSRSAASLSDFTRGLERRIRAMSKAHGLLTESRWAGASITDVLSQELDQYGGGDQFAVDGPAVILTAKAALALSLAVHELCTNAAKYGALIVPTGRIAIKWTRRPSGELDFTWTESGGPPVQQPKRRGFGSTLIERALALETGGAALLRFETEGVTCAIVLPPSAITEGSAPVASSVVHPVIPEPSPIEPPPGRASRILVVEDSALVIMVVETMLEDLGWHMVGPATRLAEAEHLAQTEEIDAAVLDVNLDGELSWPVAAHLRRRGIPFAFATGYDGHTILPPEFSDAIVIGKPFKSEEMARCIRTMVEGKDGEEAARA